MKRTETDFTCARCGTVFTSAAHHAKYCPDCRTVIQRERVKRGKQYRIGDMKNCPTCGKSFAVSSPSQIYCSVECKPKRKSSAAQVNASRRKNMDTLTFYLPKGSRAVLQGACDRLGLSISDLLRASLYEFLDKNTPEIAAKLDALHENRG